MSTWTLADIRSKVRQVSGRLSLSELSNQKLDDVINQYVQYEFPAELKLDRNYSFYEFSTIANQQDYTLPETYTNFDPEATIDEKQLIWYISEAKNTGLPLKSLSQWLFDQYQPLVSDAFDLYQEKLKHS